MFSEQNVQFEIYGLEHDIRISAEAAQFGGSCLAKVDMARDQ
jgi:hypothetical protein